MSDDEQQILVPFFPGKIPLMLDLGAGPVSPEGYTPMGRGHHGTEIYPLPYEDDTVDVIRAVHVLEHFGHREVDAVLAEWVRVLKPGGILRVAVPNFEQLADEYLRGGIRPVPDEWVIMGAQSDENDFHKSLFDREHLRQRFARQNLVLLRPWVSEIEDCASYKISLNLEGTKPAQDRLKVSGAMSVPRLGFMDTMFCAIDALIPLGVKMRRQGGAFWGQALTKCYETILEEDNPDAILTLDYDSIFTKKNAADLLQLMMAHPEADAICAVQSNRHLPTALFTVQDGEGKAMGRIPMERFEPDLLKIGTGHFGLTLLRADKLASLPKPWFHSVPDADGRWSEDGKIDEDLNFWVKWREAGNTLYLANRVPIGHAEMMVRWPGKDLQVLFQSARDFNTSNKPPEEAWE